LPKLESLLGEALRRTLPRTGIVRNDALRVTVIGLEEAIGGVVDPYRLKAAEPYILHHELALGGGKAGFDAKITRLCPSQVGATNR
jgi:hypothetical protein